MMFLVLKRSLITGLALTVSACTMTPEQVVTPAAETIPSKESVARSNASVAPVIVEEKNVVKVKPVVAPAAAKAADVAVPVVVIKKPVKEAKPATVAMPVEPGVFLVTANTKDSSHPFYGVGSKMGMAINGVQGKSLVMTRGESYTFKVNTGIKHDFYISSSARGWGAATYAKGVKGNFTYSGLVSMTPTADTPSLLYYQCRNHKNMGGKIHIINPGEVYSAEKHATPVAVVSTNGAKAAKKFSEKELKQKLSFAEMFINMSSSAKRIKASQNQEAINIYHDAQSQLAQAKNLIGGADSGRAMVLINGALKQMSTASRLVPAESLSGVEKKRYDDLLKEVETFEVSYNRNYKRISKNKAAHDLPKIDMKAIHAMKADAAELASDDDYEAANKELVVVQQRLTKALTDMLDNQTMSYELVFETIAEEYEYELSRYDSYEELVPIAIEQKRPPEQTIKLIKQFVSKAKEIKAQAGPEAEKGNYKTAILMLQGATSRVQRALRIVGVR